MSQHEISEIGNFGDRLRAVRERMGFNQRKFAALGGVGLGSQSRYEAGETEPNSSYLSALALAGIDVMYLLIGRASCDLLDPDATELVGYFDSMGAELKSSMLHVARAAAASADQERVVHATHNDNAVE